MSDNTQIDLREKRRQELGETQFSTNAQGGALMQPRNGKELMDMANMMSSSGSMIREFYRGNPGDCAALIMICQPYGFNPFMVSWKTYKASKNADAPISFEGQLVNAMVNQSAPVKGRLKYTYDGEGQTRRCTVVGIDKETGEEITYTSPQIKDIPVKNSPSWKGDPDQQLGYYSARAWARRHFPELLLGVYTREEIEEAPRPPRDVTPREAKPGGFAARAQAARQQAEPGDAQDATDAAEAPTSDEQHTDTLDGEVLPDANEDAAPDEQQGQERGGTPERSFEYDEGATAFRQGKTMTECPYDPEKDPASADQYEQWRNGWFDASEEADQEGGDA
ncbi:recombinase RecT [Phaeobacter gallaeciensis]|uniref:recombinase RecT n=1 Tax=Phaeobacter gallaeciensis TaxID=60890 RepID=UPI00237F3C76|nr:recombinase RecT [Phaeobacter gallaeciensis]MDE4303581.1 recombinase RecT [Phaeobacter gallaeciensis]MDE4307937.1 recombinase RecT [Phaeobacter gallaeciensis]MDE4312395.1 recombinase RecT [Phaeobacter gallaeciensis]MDE4316866.1 recombinase RecT [Phaeobacter gallaeciensis]MDE4321329.1 recombinase RecT [Phaeobacter gallaeciensis]